MQWHQKNTIGANYADKVAASARGICQGCALSSAHSTLRSLPIVRLYSPKHWIRRIYLCSLVHWPGFPTGIPRVCQVQADSGTHWEHVQVVLCTSWMEAQWNRKKKLIWKQVISLKTSNSSATPSNTAWILHLLETNTPMVSLRDL